jgi:quercetin dioxygenase-like cupin family protein
MYFQSLSDFSEKEMFPGYWGRFVHGDTMTVAFWNIKAGSSIPLHHHVHEQVMHVLEGKFEFTVDGNTQICEKGAVVVIPSNVPHKGKSLTDCRIIDVFHPVREDYRVS